MDINKIKILNFILFFDFVLYICSNIFVLKYGANINNPVFILIVRDVIIFLFSIYVYIYFCNPQVVSMVLFPKINNKIIKNSIIIGILFFLISTEANLIFTNIFKFTLKKVTYLNNIYDTYNLGLGFIFYIVIYTVLVEIFFRLILNDAFKFLNYKIKIIFSSFIYAVFFFGFHQIFYGFIVGVLLMNFLNRVSNITSVIISGTVINILNYIVKFIGENFKGRGFEVNPIITSRGNIFLDLIFPIILILLSLIFVSILSNNLKSSKGLKKVLSNVVELDVNIGVKNVFDIYSSLFISTSFLVLFLSYIFL